MISTHSAPLRCINLDALTHHSNGTLISVTGEMIWYGILDLLLGPLFLFYFLFSLRNVDYSLFGLNSGKYTDGPYGTGAGRSYKTAGRV